MEGKLFKDMTAEEQSKWLTDFAKYNEEKLPLLEQLGDAWEQCHIKDMEEGLNLIFAFSNCRDFVEKTYRYGDYAARVKRLEFYMNLLKKKFNEGQVLKGVRGNFYGVAGPLRREAPRRGRPASAETIAKREAEAKAAEQQTDLFPAQGGGNNVQSDTDTSVHEPAMQAEVQSPSQPSQPKEPTPPFILPNVRDDAEYKLSIAQKRAFLSPDLQKLADQIRALRTTAGAAAEKAKTMAELKASPELIAPVATEAQRTLEQVEAIYTAIDQELAAVWYRLQNDSDDWRRQWLQKYGFIKPTDGKDVAPNAAVLLHPDLLHDLKKHYKKITEAQPDFDARMRLVVEKESPEYIEQQKQEAARKKEAQDIVRYLRRKENATAVRLNTSREKFKRLEELLGKKDAAVYKPLLTKIEDDFKASQKETAKAAPKMKSESKTKTNKKKSTKTSK